MFYANDLPFLTSISYSFKTLKPIMNSYPYFTLQQKLENIDESLKEIVLNYIQLSKIPFFYFLTKKET